MGPSARHGGNLAKSLNGLGHGLEMGGGLIMLKTLSWAFLGAGIMLLSISLAGNYFQFLHAKGCFIMPSAVPPISITKGE